MEAEESSDWSDIDDLLLKALDGSDSNETQNESKTSMESPTTNDKESHNKHEDKVSCISEENKESVAEVDINMTVGNTESDVIHVDEEPMPPVATHIELGNIADTEMVPIHDDSVKSDNEIQTVTGTEKSTSEAHVTVGVNPVLNESDMVINIGSPGDQSDAESACEYANVCVASSHSIDSTIYTALTPEEDLVIQVDFDMTLGQNTQVVCSDSEMNIPLSELRKDMNKDTVADSLDDGTDMDIPLAQLKQKVLLNIQKSSPVSSPPPMSDSDMDIDYKPSKQEINSSDSESNEDIVGAIKSQKQQRSRRKLHFKRDTNWKKVGKHIKRKIIKVQMKSRSSDLAQKLNLAIKKQKGVRQPKTGRNNKSANSFTNSDLLRSPSASIRKAIDRSRKDQLAREVIEKYHNQKLNKILTTNGYKRQPIYPDGNCLLNAFLFQLNPMSLSSSELREKIVQHILENFDHYSDFMKINEGENLSIVKERIRQLEEDGHWQSEYADFVPLCLANMFNTTICIFSSRAFTPVFTIEPSLHNDHNNQDKVVLAHLALARCEHYDAVSKLNIPDNNENQVRENTPERTTGQSPIITPHKHAKYVSPVKKKLFRKRRSNPEEWKANKRKQQKSTGKGYVSKTGKEMPARSMQSKDCSKCRFKCSARVNDEQQQELFNVYWALGDYDKQRGFICSNVNVAESKATNTSKKRRSKALSFFFTVNGQQVRVCKDFFLKTLNIGRKTVDSAVTKMKLGVYVGQDERGRKTPGNKTPKNDELFVHNHIKSFPVIESHYTRKDSRRKYLPQDLNITKMYDLYKDECTKSGRKPVSSSYYRRVFNTQYNFSFFHPKKDQCSICSTYEQQKHDGILTDEQQEKYDFHQERKIMSREEKAADKSRALTDNSLLVSTFDLQAVLSCPCSLVGELYYKRKLSCYNLSFYNLGSGGGHCFLWDETHAGRGSCEVGTCIYLYINSLTGQGSPVREITFYSDTCGGQNRNKFVTAALHHALISSNTLKVINHKFFESGHSQMESDSIHSSIETAKKNTRVFLPSEWETVVHFARKTKPYMIVPIKYSDIKDFKQLVKDGYKNMTVDVNGKRVNWNHIKWIQLLKEEPDCIYMGYTFQKESLFKINIKAHTRKAGRPKGSYFLQQRYQNKIPISVQKKNDLMSLCTSNIIPEAYHHYYRNLATQKQLKDKLPMPDAEETDCETDEN